MAKKKKIHKKERRLNEAKKAQEKHLGREVRYEEKQVVKTEFVASKSEQVLLPLSEIKRDLLKNVAYAVFSILLLIILNNTGFGTDTFSRLFRL